MMKNSLILLMMTTMLFSFTACNAQTKNTKTEIVKIYGNCGMCKTTIEEAGNVKKEALVDWNKDTKMATISYDSLKTSSQEILKRIALAGYDSDQFLSPDDTYSKLPKCCKYDRAEQVKATSEKEKQPRKTPEATHAAGEEELGNAPSSNETAGAEEKNQLLSVFNQYFALKDGLVKSNSGGALSSAKLLLKEISDVQMDKLPADVHVVWMKVLAPLKKDAERIANTKDLSKQRDYFIELSKNMHSLIALTKMDSPVYYQKCPMANDGKGATWLSKEKTIKNPYYGAQMLSCGSTLETIKE